MATDLILSFFATPGGAQASACKTDVGTLTALSQPVSLLKNPVVVCGEWPMDPTQQHTGMFRAFAGKARNGSTKRILPALVAYARKVKGISDDIGRIAVVDFSAGRCMASEVLQHADDRANVDTVIDMDGLNLVTLWNGKVDPGTRLKDGTFMTGWTQGGVGVWAEYGRLALNSQHLLVNWHTDIPAPVGGGASTTAANALLYQMLSSMVAEGETAISQAYDPQALYAGPPPPDAYTPAQNDKARTWSVMPQLDVQDVGNCHRIRMPGSRGGAHIFSCYWGQGAVWRTFLVPRWNDPNPGRCTSATGVNGMGRAFGQVPAAYGITRVDEALLAAPYSLLIPALASFGASGAGCVKTTTKASDVGGDSAPPDDDPDLTPMAQADEGGPGLWDAIVEWGTGLVSGEDAMSYEEEPPPPDEGDQQAVRFSRSASAGPVRESGADVTAAALKREMIKPVVGAVFAGLLLFVGYKVYKIVSED